MQAEEKTDKQAITYHVQVKNGIEYRYDPLVGTLTRTNPARATRPMSTAASPSSRNALAEIIEESKDKDPFAPYDKLNSLVPKLDASILEHVNIIEGSQIQIVDERLKCGEAIIFPNKFPFGMNHAVTVMSDAHYIALKDFTHKQIYDALHVTMAYIQAVVKIQSEASRMWPAIVWNYMPPSAGSIIHPHLQVFVEDQPHPYLAHTLQCAKLWRKSPKDHAQALAAAIASGDGLTTFAAAGHLGLTPETPKANEIKPAEAIPSFYKTLALQEKELNLRYIGQYGSCVALAPYASRGTNEVHVCIPQVAAITDLTFEQLSQLSHCFAAVLRAYAEAGVGSFNMVSMSASTASTDDERSAYGLHFKFISRPFPSGLYTNDSGPTERMYDVFVINSVPEVYAPCFKTVWDKYFEELQK